MDHPEPAPGCAAQCCRSPEPTECRAPCCQANDTRDLEAAYNRLATLPDFIGRRSMMEDLLDDALAATPQTGRPQ